MTTKSNTERVFAQIAMPDWMFDAWGAYAEGKGIEKQVILEQFIGEFIDDRQDYVSSTEEVNNVPRYLVLHVAPPKSKPRSLWLKASIYERAENFVKETDNRVNRLIFSAMLEGLVKAGLVRV